MLQPKKSSNGLTESDNAILVKELTNYANEGASDDDLKQFRDTFISAKKKSTPNTDATSPAPKPKSESPGVSANTSSGTVKNNLTPDPFNRTSSVNPTGAKPTIHQEYNRFKEKTTVSDDEEKQIRQEVEDIADEKGFANTAKSLAKKTWNTAADVFTAIGTFGTETSAEDSVKFDLDPLVDEKKEALKIAHKAKAEAKAHNKPEPVFGEVEIVKLAKEIKVNKLVKAQQESKERDFLLEAQETQGSSGVDKKAELLSFAAKSYKTVSEKDKLLLTKSNILREALTESVSEIKEMNKKAEEYKKSGQQMPDEFVDEYNAAAEKYKSLIKDEVKTNEDYVSNKENLGDLSENIDILKRNYGWVRNFYGNLEIGLGELAKGTVGLVDYGLGLKGAVVGTNEYDEAIRLESRDINRNLSSEQKKVEDDIAKPITVDGINSASDLGKWMVNLAGGQVPILSLIATGAPGIAAIGLTSTGAKYSELQIENAEEGAHYSEGQMLGVSTAFGATDTLSAIVDKILLGNASRVIKSATSTERNMMAKGMAQQLFANSKNLAGSVTKGVVFEGGEEGLTQFSQNVIDIYALGKDKPLFEGVKDAAAAGAALGAAIPLVAGSYKMASDIAKTYSTDTKIQAASAEILKLEKQLDNPEISTTSRKIISEQLAASKSKVESLLEKVVGNVSNLTDEHFAEIIRLEKAQAVIKSNVTEIESDPKLNAEMKKQILGNLKTEFDANNQRRIDLIERGGNKELNKLGDDELIIAKEQAARTLMKELNPDGTKTITLTDDQITKRAGEMLAEKNTKREAKQQPVVEQTTTDANESTTDVESAPSVSSVKRQHPVIGDVANTYSDQDIERRMSEIESQNPKSGSSEQDEFNSLEKEMEKREWLSITQAPLTKVNEVLDALSKKEKEMPNGFGAFIDPADATRTRAVIERYQKASSILDDQIYADFTEGLRGNPEIIISAAIKLRESINEATKRGIAFESLLNNAKEKYTKDGYDSETAESVLKMFLQPIFQNAIQVNPENESTSPTNTSANGEVRPGSAVVEQNGNAVEESTVAEELSETTNGGTIEESVEVKEKSITETQIKQNKLVDARNEFNKLGARDKKGAKGNSLRTTIAEFSKDLGFQTSESNGKISVKTPKGTEAGKITIRQEIVESTKEDVDHALSEIEKGVISWNGSTFSPRIDLGITWADIRKGEQDLKNGKPNTVPAKRLVQALAQAKKKGVYAYVEGSGGNMISYDVPVTDTLAPSEDMLSPEDEEAVGRDLDALATEYDSYFNSLDEETQNQILDDYENKPRAVSGNAERGKSQENASNQDGTGKEKGKSERKAIADAKIDEVADWLKSILPKADINAGDYDAQGFTQNQIIDLIAKAAKSLVATGIDINEAIKQVVEALKQKFDFDVTTQSIKDRILGNDATVWVQENLETLVQSYIEKNPTKIDPDVIRESFVELGYTGMNVPVFRRAEAILVNAIYDKMLDSAENKTIAILTGTGGSGKTFATKSAGFDFSKKGLIFDSALNHFKSLSDVIDRAKSKGFEVEVIAVYNDPVTSFKNTINRGFKEGRFLSLNYFVSAFMHNQGKANSLIEEYPDVKVTFLDNSNNETKKVTAEDAKLWDYDLTPEKVYNLLKTIENDSERFNEDQLASLADGLRGITAIERYRTGDIEGYVRRIEERVQRLRETGTRQEVGGTNGDGGSGSVRLDNSGKGNKSLLNRAHSGGNPKEIADAIEKHGLNYEIENQEKAKAAARKFIDEVGAENALDAARAHKIKGAEKAFVYSEIVNDLMNEYESASDEDKEALQTIRNEIVSEITAEFDQEARDAGRFISALYNIYNSSALKYNLEKNIADYKASNNGEIPENILEKFKEADAKIKELEGKIAEAEKKAREAEEQLSIKNIQEDIQRKKVASQKVSSKTEKAKKLANKIRQAKIHKPQIFSSATPASLVWDGAIEIIAKSIEAGGTLTDALQKGIEHIRASKWYKNLNPEKQNEAQKALRDHIEESTKEPFVSIDEDGKIHVPERVIRDYVESGVTDINDLSQKILDTLKEDYPDVTLRDVRDAITKYGKSVNLNQEEIATEIRKMKRVGKLISGLEDANKGKRPERSGLQRDKISRKEREMQRELKDLLRDIPMNDTDLSLKWKTALDAVKTRLKNHIEDLEKQIANGEKSKPERNPVAYDQEARDLKQRRDDLKTVLEDMVGKPELSEEQKIKQAERLLENSIDKLKTQIADQNLSYKQKPTRVTSAKIEELRQSQKALRETLEGMRKDAGVAEQKRLDVAKARVKARIETLNEKIRTRNYAKKVSRPLVPDDELTMLNAEKIKYQEIFDKEKYASELANRSRGQKIFDGIAEVLNIPRILKATGELSFVGIQGGILTVSRKFTNPIELYRIMKKLFSSIGSDKKARQYENILRAHPLYQVAVKSKLALTNPDYKTEVREENFTGDYMNLFWDLPLLAMGKTKAGKEITPIGQSIKSAVAKIFNREAVASEKITVREQWKNLNPFVALERGGTLYMNQLRFEEFVRGSEMLRMEGKNPIDHLSDYKLLANAINTMSGRANIGMLATNSKTLAAIFFSFRNAVSVFNQMNPLYYTYLHFRGSDSSIKKTSVANKLAVANMIKFITITGATITLLKALAGTDDDGEEIIEIEQDPRSSDFLKMKIGNIRFDPWHGMSTQAVLYARLFTEETKSTKTGLVTQLGKSYGGTKNRAELLGRYVTNKFAPSMAIVYKYASTNINKEGERVTAYGEKYTLDDESLNMAPMYWAAVNEIQKEDPNGWAEFLTVVSAFGLNTGVYSDKKKVDETEKKPSGPKPIMQNGKIIGYRK